MKKPGTARNAGWTEKKQSYSASSPADAPSRAGCCAAAKRGRSDDAELHSERDKYRLRSMCVTHEDASMPGV